MKTTHPASFRALVALSFLTFLGACSATGDGHGHAVSENASAASTGAGSCDGFRVAGGDCSTVPMDVCRTPGRVDGCVYSTFDGQEICGGTFRTACTYFHDKAACENQYPCSWSVSAPPPAPTPGPKPSPAPPPSPAPSPPAHVDFVKHGNDGTVACDRFCAGPEWGEVGACVGAVRGDSGVRVPCNSPAPHLGGRELSCECLRPVPPASVDFVKHGNNGTVTCSTYCRGPQWGAPGSCIGAIRGDSGQRVFCDTRVGALDGPELSCECRNPSAVHGNNGTVSCNAFCARSGSSCGTSVRADTGQVLSCADVPGDLGGPELTCGCVL